MMSSLARRDRERQETRDRILDAARELFARNGYENVTMRAIAKRIEYTPTAIYHHFKDKEALLTELCRVDFRALAGAFLKVGWIEDPVERLQTIGAAYVDFALEHPQQYRFLFLIEHPEEVEHPEKENPEEDAYGVLRQTIVDCIASGRLRAEYREPDQVAQEPRQTARLMMDAMVRGMLK
jgi:AcrR family transcriptional regulator